MPSSKPSTQLHFFCEEPFKGFARLEGIATIGDHGVTFEYAMTESAGARLKSSVRKHLSFSDISSIELRKHWLSASRFRFRARTPMAIDTFPTIDPSVFEIEVAAQSQARITAFDQAVRKAVQQHLGPEPESRTSP